MMGCLMTVTMALAMVGFDRFGLEMNILARLYLALHVYPKMVVSGAARDLRSDLGDKGPMKMI